MKMSNRKNGNSRTFSFSIRKKEGNVRPYSAYVISFAILAWFWYAPGSFGMETAVCLLSAAVLLLALFYVWSVAKGGKRVVLTTGIYLLLPVGLFLITEVREAFLGFAGKAADFLSEYGVQGDIFHRLSAGASVEVRTENVEFFPFLLAGVGISCWLVLLFTLLREKLPLLFFVVVAFGVAYPFFFWGVRPEIFGVLSFLVFCFFYFCPSFFAGSLGTVLVTVVLLGSVILGNTESGTFSSLQKKWNAWKYQETETVLPEGNLNDAKKTERSEDKTALKVTLTMKNGYYLRGFVGTSYEDGRWEEDKNKNKTASNLFGNGEDMESASWTEAYRKLLWLHGRGFYMNTMLFQTAARQEQAEGKSQPSLYTLSVENVGADRKYLYLPYECAADFSVYEEEGTAALDNRENLHASGFFGAGTYSCLVTENLAGKLDLASAQSGSDLTEAEKKERETCEEYIASTCLFLNKETKSLIASVMGKTMQGDVSVTTVIGKVKSWLKNNVTYSENPGEIPEDSDFTHWFFAGETAADSSADTDADSTGSGADSEKNSTDTDADGSVRCGYDVHYASAAVMLFRYYGVPARYVEGYLLTPAAAKNAGSASTVSISQKYAHAWAEIYLEGVGWIPVEVTPGYEELMGTPYYFTETAAKSESSALDSGEEEDETSTQEEEDSQEKEDSTSENTETAKSSEEKKQSAGKNAEADGENQSNKNNGKKAFALLKWLFPLLLLFAAGVIFLFRRKICEAYWNKKERRLLSRGKYGEAVELRYDILCGAVFGRGKKDRDNRLKTLEKMIRRADGTVNVKKLRRSLAIRQKAIYSPAEISEKEAVEATRFFKEEYERVRK